MDGREQKRFLIAVLLIALSRLPFIFSGYGSEEDAWALPMVAERIGTTGHYEVSRLPGHPVQEYVYSAMWNTGPVTYNMVTVLLSTIGIAFFMLALRSLNLTKWIEAGLGVAFTPIVFIHCTNDMDYTWAMAFTLLSLWCVTQRYSLMAGAFLALGIGCRLTTGAMLIPLMMLMWVLLKPTERIREILKFAGFMVSLTILIWLPVVKEYGPGFFRYYEFWPYPNWQAVIYKGIILPWGIPGIAFFFLAKVWIARNWKFDEQIQANGKNVNKSIVFISIVAIVLYFISYFKLPFKAAFIIPMVPFVWIYFSMWLPGKGFSLLVAGMLVSCFTMGVNLSDPLRGSAESQFAIHKKIGGQSVAFDLLNGPVNGDLTKRVQRTAYVQSVLKKVATIKSKTVIIAGWWNADLLVLQRGHENILVHWVYYVDEPELAWYKRQGYSIYFLPEQDQYNDLRYKKTFTHQFAVPF